MGDINGHTRRDQESFILADVRRDGDYWYVIVRVRNIHTGGLEAASGPRHKGEVRFWTVIHDLGACFRIAHRRINTTPTQGMGGL